MANISREMVEYGTKIVFTLIVLVFCMVMISINNDSKSIFINILSYLLGIWLPSPSINKTTNQSNNQPNSNESMV